MVALLCTALFSVQGFAASFADHIKDVSPPRPVPAMVFEDGEGQQHALSDYRGSYILLNVWATWCGPCVQEMPSLEALAQTVDAHKLKIIPLSDDRGDNTVTAFYKTHALSHLPVALDHAGVAPVVLHLRGLPTTLLIDPQGNEIARLEGDADWSSPDVMSYLKARIH